MYVLLHNSNGYILQSMYDLHHFIHIVPGFAYHMQHLWKLLDLQYNLKECWVKTMLVTTRV